VLAVPGGESSDAAGNSLTFALLWLRRTRESSCRGAVTGVRIILPKNSCGIVAHRLAALDPQLAVELYEHDPALNILEKIDRRRAGNLDTWLVPHRESETLLNQARPVLDAIISLAPHAVTLHPAAQSREVWLRFRGLPFARWDSGRVFFGINDAREELTPASRPALKHLLHDLEVHRHPFSSDTRHSLYRLQPERWLESIVHEDVTRIDAMLDQRFVYAHTSICRCRRRTIGCVFAGSCRAERSLAMVIFKGSLCSRPRRSSISSRPPCDSIQQPMIF